MNRRQFAHSISALLATAGAPAAAQQQWGAQRLEHALATTRTGRLRPAWEAFKARFIKDDGRVVDTGNAQIVHTESLGVAMLGAQAAHDLRTFESTWAFAQKLRRPDGLFSWRWVPGAGVTDPNNATDGDLYLAWALSQAGHRFSRPDLKASAVELAAAIRRSLLVTVGDRLVLKAGAVGFERKTPTGGDVVIGNPSYWILPAYKALATAEGSEAWWRLHTDALGFLSASLQGVHGLTPDWLELTPTEAAPWKERPPRFGYEAIRVPLFLVWDRQWAHPALRGFARWAQKPGFPSWVDLQTGARGEYAAPAGFEAVARLARRASYGSVPSGSLASQDLDYYSSSLTMLCELAAEDIGFS